MRGVGAFLLLILISAVPVSAAPETSPRPVARAHSEPGLRVPKVPVFYNPEVRPRARPGSARARGVQPQVVAVSASTAGIYRSPRPQARPARQRRAAAVVQQRQPAPVAAGRGGKICGDRTIRGQKLSRIPGKLRGCGVANPVQVTSVDGVPLSRPATMDCTTAKALKSWVKEGVKPSVGRLGGGVARINVIAGYSCRTRNSIPGAKISEHGRGKAVDVSGITLNNGTTVSVLKGWNIPAQRKLLTRMHKAACGRFGTVLGPKSDRYHRDHFHLDTAKHRSGAYCR